MADIALDAVAYAVERCIASFVCGCKLEKHVSERLHEGVDFLFGFKPHDYFLSGRAAFNSTAMVGQMQQKTGAT